MQASDLVRAMGMMLGSLCLLGTQAISGQESRIVMEGRVLDQSRSPIAGARIVAAGPGGRVMVVAAGMEGEFAIPVAAGSYAVTVSATGFQEVKRVVEAAGRMGTLEFVLPVVSQRTSVTVTESAGYQVAMSSTATKTATALIDIPQSITVVSRELIRDQMMMSMADVVRYVPGITMATGEGHRDAPVIRGNSTTSDFYVNGVRDDVQYFRDLYNLERVEAVKGPNAMIFGRGGGGGVINRVTKEAGFSPLREITLQGGSFGNKRAAADFGQPLGRKAAFRLNGMYENSESFRNYFHLERYGIAPTVTVAFNDRTRVRVSYEYFHDGRLTDRGIPSYQGRPAPAHRSTFFGNPEESPTHADVHLGSAVVERQFGARLSLRNSTLFGAYDKFYQNVFPGAVTADLRQVSLSGYNTATQRGNVFNQTDANYVADTWLGRHTLLVGAEVGRQATDNFRQTAYFRGTATSINVPFANPVDFTPVVWRQAATDADNRPVNTVAAGYVQDQVNVTRFVQLIGGLRFDRFDLHFRNNRTQEERRRKDHLLSPRAGVVIKPVAPLSLYYNYSVAYLPSSGDQFGSLDATTQTLKPEKFLNHEAGVKMDVRRYLSVTAGVYRLNRTNTRAVDPNNPAVIVQTGSQRTNGVEMGINGNVTGKWTVAGGYGYQDAYISSATAAARLGALVAMVPRHTFSMWNNYRILPRLSGGVGLIHQAEMWAGIDNTVLIPNFTRGDAAVYYSLTEKMRLQANVENVTDRRYVGSAHSNNNLAPGNARTVRVGMTVRF
ncbi:MAG: TonB-dependent siderophore receptor [Acidobacteria bacterium]|nr:TonB-dependent siderophore receptor [Acidobacteriota bacterium]